MPKSIEGIIEVLTAPLIVYPGGWEDTLPEWIKTEVTLQRMVRLMKGDDDLATDAEATAYLYTASLTAPMSADWAKIYFHLVTKLKGKAIPSDIRVEMLPEYQEGELKKLKEWIVRKQRKVLDEKKRAERRTEQQERRGEQLAIFPM